VRPQHHDARHQGDSQNGDDQGGTADEPRGHGHCQDVNDHNESVKSVTRVLIARAVTLGPVSWWMHVLPLHRSSAGDGWAWVTSAEVSRGVPDLPPPPAPLPTAVQVVDALRAAGGHGSAWFRVPGLDLPDCPPNCSRDGCLGEVTLHAGDDGSGSVTTADDPVSGIGFRKPEPAAVLRAVLELTAAGGAQLICDDAADTIFVVWPGDHLDDLLATWPW
jgi:hypothetical protein